MKNPFFFGISSGKSFGLSSRSSVSSISDVFSTLGAKAITKHICFTRLFCFLSLVFCLFCFACSDSNDSTGMGESLDLEAAHITISSPSMAAYTKTSFKISGTCYDNKEVKRVTIEQKQKDGSFVLIKDANINGNTWEADLTLSEGVQTLQCTALDREKQVASFSKKQIVLLVDDNPPEGQGWYIDRLVSGIRCPFNFKDALEALDLGKIENKDAAQNVAFKVAGKMTDAMGVQNVKLHIYEKTTDAQGTQTKKQICQIDNSSGNNYTPEFNITQDILVQGDPALASGKHYLYISYTASDVAGNSTGQPIEVDLGCFLWWPESDIPHIEPKDTTTGENGKPILDLFVKGTVQIDIFDDDELDTAYCAFLTQDEYDELKTSCGNDLALLKTNPKLIVDAIDDGQSDKSKRSSSFLSNGDGTRDITVALTAPASAKKMQFVAVAKDKTAKGEVFIKEMDVFVKDQSVPILFIQSPERNTVPQVDCSTAGKATFDIKGQVIDASGAQYLEFVFVPDSKATNTQQKQQKASSLLNSISSTHSSYAPQGAELTKKTVFDSGEYAGLVLWSVKLGAKISSAGGYYKQEFTLPLDIFCDFANEKKNDKFFLVQVTRADGVNIQDTYRLSGDSLPPSIQVINPSCDMQIVEQNKGAFTLEFRGKKASNLGMDKTLYKIYKYDSTNKQKGSELPGIYDATSDTYKAVINDWTGYDAMSAFMFSATDLLGNQNSSVMVCVLSSLPVLKSVSTNKSNGSVLKIGDTIDISTTFSDCVIIEDTKDVTKQPKLKLQFIANGPVKYATYKEGSLSNTIVFSYTVQQGDTSAGLLCYNEADATVAGGKIGPIDTTGGTILPASGGQVAAHFSTLEDANNLQAKKTIKIDGIAPKIQSLSFMINDTPLSTLLTTAEPYYCNGGKKITAVLKTDDTVMVQGRPVINLTLGASDVLQLPFTKAQGQNIYFETTVDENTANGDVFYDMSTCLSSENLKTITDVAGNPIQAGAAAKISAKITIDTKAPPSPVVSLNGDKSPRASFMSKSDVAFSITAEENSKIEYTTDGGKTWTLYNANAPTNTLGDGEYQFIAKAQDKAGNTSPLSAPISIDIVKGFPVFEVDCTNPQGHYKAGSILKFKVAFSRNVTLSSLQDIKIYLCDGSLGQGDRVKDKTGSDIYATPVPTVAIGKPLSVVEFSYKVKSPDSFKVKIAKSDVVLAGVKDAYGNTFDPATNILLQDYNCNVICDSVAPVVVSCTPISATNKAIKTADDGKKIYDSVQKIEIVFSEEVTKNTGNLTVRQAPGWSIPPVLSEAEFSSLYSELSSTDKQKLKAKNSTGADYNTITGLGLGPYIKTTQGLKIQGSNYVPDTDTKYVLDFKYDIDSTQDKTVNDIRATLEKLHFHEYIIDVTSTQVQIDPSDNKKVTLTIATTLGTPIENGRKWQVCIDKGAFCDATSNAYGADENGNIDTNVPYQSLDSVGGLFYSDKVATPVIRVDRHSYGVGPGYVQYNQSGVASNIQSNTTSPKDHSYVRVKIQSQTPGAVISYDKEQLQDTDTTAGPTDLGTLTLNKSIQDTHSFVMSGEQDWQEAFRDFYVATASKGTGSAAFEGSDRGFEGVYKTVVIFTAPQDNNNWRIHGSIAEDKISLISGFPLMDAPQKAEPPFAKQCFHENGNSYWFTYEIVCDFIAGGWAGNWSKTKPQARYGHKNTFSNMQHW